ncbi:hypothetical protein QFZ77_005405 [Paenibacillus sp. V4I3]|nr:hypothetical protein [Paenibacillus sp. V4I3]
MYKISSFITYVLCPLGFVKYRGKFFLNLLECYYNITYKVVTI